MLPQFILPEALKALAEESNALTHEAYFFRSTHNAYLTEDDPEQQVALRLRLAGSRKSAVADCPLRFLRSHWPPRNWRKAACRLICCW